MSRATAAKESGEDDSGVVRHISSPLPIAEALCLEFVKFVVFGHLKGDPGKMSAMVPRITSNHWYFFCLACSFALL